MTKRLTRLPLKKSSLIDKIAGGEAAHDNTAGEGVAVRDKTAGESEAIRDKIAGGKAVRNKTAGGEAVRDNTAEEIVDILDKIAGGEAILDKTAGGVEAARDKAVESPVWAEKPVEAKKGPRGRRRWWYVRGERVCRRSAGGGGTFEVNVSAGDLLEVCQKLEVCRRSTRGWRSARGLPEVGRKCTKFESQRLLPTREEKYYSHTVG